MNSSIEHSRLLYKVARDYYYNQLTQNEIAKRFGLSRIKISRLLKQARLEKVVNISLNAPANILAEEEELEKKYHLEEVLLVACENENDQNSVINSLAPSAAECLLRRISNREIIGVAMGKTMMAVVNFLSPTSCPHVKIVQMNGGLGHVVTLEQSAELARQMSTKLSAELHLLHAPGIAFNKKAADVFKKDILNSKTLALAAHADIAILSIGIITKNIQSLKNSLVLSDNDITNLKERQAIGDIALRFLNKEGQPAGVNLDDRIVGLTFEELVKIPCVIAVAGGVEKHQAILAALKSKIPNVLITDSKTGEYLLNADV